MSCFDAMKLIAALHWLIDWAKCVATVVLVITSLVICAAGIKPSFRLLAKSIMMLSRQSSSANGMNVIHLSY